MRTDGFTLLEVLVAVAILALISAMLWYSFSQTFESIDLVRADADLLRQSRQVTSRIPRELQSAFLPLSLSPTAGAKYEFVGEDEGDLDKIRFDSLSHTKLYQDANESDQSELAYFVEDDPKNAGLYRLMRREDPVIDDRPEEGGTALVIAERVKVFDLTYYDANRDEWLDEWDSTRSDQSGRLPYSVRMRLTMVADDGKERTWITAALVRLAKTQEAR